MAFALKIAISSGMSNVRAYSDSARQARTEPGAREDHQVAGGDVAVSILQVCATIPYEVQDFYEVHLNTVSDRPTRRGSHLVEIDISEVLIL